MKERNIPKIVMSEIRGAKILYIDKDPSRADEFESNAEQDNRLQRISVYTATDLARARDLARTHNCDLAIYHEGIDGKDFVFIQMELRSAQPKMELIPIIAVPTIEQLSSHRKIGGVFAFADIKQFTKYENLVTLILSYLREFASDSKGIAEAINFATTLQNFLKIRSPGLGKIKDLSTKMTESLLIFYDLDSRTMGLTMAAEMLFDPSVFARDFKGLVKYDKYGFGDLLSHTASWQHVGSVPSSVPGLLITLGNFLATQIVEKIPVGEICFKIAERPSFLKHPAIRTLSEANIKSVIAKATSQVSSNHVKTS